MARMFAESGGVSVWLNSLEAGVICAVLYDNPQTQEIAKAIGQAHFSEGNGTKVEAGLS